MTLDEFLTLVDGASDLPDGLSDELAALWFGRRDQWDRSHRIAQEIDTPLASWIHAWLHRVEGDLSNADYWYRRAGRPSCRDDLRDEWMEIVGVAIEKI